MGCGASVARINLHDRKAEDAAEVRGVVGVQCCIVTASCAALVALA